MILFADIDELDSITILCEAGEKALQRAQDARRAGRFMQTAAYLRATITCARQMHQHAKEHPNFWRHAVMLLDEVTSLAWECEDHLFAQGQAGAARFVTLLVQAAGLRMTIADAISQAQIADDPDELAAAAVKCAEHYSAEWGHPVSAASFYTKARRADASPPATPPLPLPTMSHTPPAIASG
jgi:hypothetical protein